MQNEWFHSKSHRLFKEHFGINFSSFLWPLCKTFKTSVHVVAMDMDLHFAARSTILEPRLPRLGQNRDLDQKRSNQMRFDSCSSLPVFVLCAAKVAKSRRHKVSMKSIRDAREAIRQCLRENRTMPVLQALPEDSLQQILDTMTRMELKPGDHIFRKGEPVDAVYVVESGELSVVKPLRQGDEDLGH